MEMPHVELLPNGPFLEDHLFLDKCPSCKVDKPNLYLIDRIFETWDRENGKTLFWGVYCCNRCGRLVVAYSTDNSYKLVEDYFPKSDEVHHCIPPGPRHYLIEAINALHAPSASIMAASSAVDSMLVDKGYNQKNLYAKIKAANENHLITAEMEKWANQVRLSAIDERHPKGKVDFPTTKDAQRTIEFALALAEFLFVLPYKVEQGLQKTSDDRETPPEKGGQGGSSSK